MNLTNIRRTCDFLNRIEETENGVCFDAGETQELKVILQDFLKEVTK